ncbi:MAG: redoxin domain-containing protein [Cyclobacteriaceae bacterium]|nr:redoxin domain-containing protein [Cyclobacteriaceae bacterium]
MQKLFVLIGILTITVFSKSKAQVHVGEIIPDISIEKWIENPNYEFQGIENKAIVLDFWYTTCAPCVYTIPHLNDLSKLYAKEDIVFVAVSFEEETTIKKFLAKKKILANIGSDTARNVIDEFGINLYPTTFLIDKTGNIRWRGYPAQLTTEMIDELLRKKYYPQIKAADPTTVSAALNNDFDKELIYPIEVNVNNSMNGVNGMQFNKMELSYVNRPLEDVVAFLLDKKKNTILVKDTNRYDIRFKIPPEIPTYTIKDKITESLMTELGYKLKTEKKLVEGYIMHLVKDSLFIQNAIDTTKVYHGMGTSATQTHWKGSGILMQILIQELESMFKILIDDQTALNGYFEFDIPISSFEETRNYLLKTYGLSLNPSQLEIKILVVE